MRTNQQALARFDELFREHHDAVQAYARRRVPPGVVDDVVAETFLVAWRKLDSVPQEPLPWLFGVARNEVSTQRRGDVRRQRLWDKAKASLSATAEIEELPGCGDDDAVLAALARMSERDREALTLVAWDGLTPAQAAAVVGESPNRFRVRLHRAGRRLRFALTSQTPPEVPASNQPASQMRSKGALL